MKKLNRTKLIVALFIFAIVACVATIIVLSVLEIKSHKHDYSAQIIAPTCAEEGYTLHKCACGSSYKSDTVSALGHDYAEEFTVDLQPDCTEKGSKSKHCSRCESTSEVTEIPANGHTFGEWETKLEAKCLKEGVEARECGVCSTVQSRPIKALEHKFGEWDVVTEGTCTVGQVRSRACGLCGNDEFEYSQPLGHVVEYVSEVYYHGGICDRCKNTVQEKHNFKGTVCADCNYEVFPTQGLEYSLNEDGKSYTVTGFGTATDTDLVIFSTYNGLPVTSIGKDAFQSYNGKREIGSVIIYDNITELQDGALNNDRLESVILPQTLTYISPSAFLMVTLNKVTVDKSNPVYHSVDDKYIIETATKTLWLSAADTIPADSSVTSIGDYAFSCRHNMKELVIPDTITKIGSMAFSYCLHMTDVKIPNSVTEIGRSAFYSCYRLTSVEIPPSVKRIEDTAFNFCPDLKSVIIGDGVTYIGSMVFASSQLTEIFIPKSVTQIEFGAFMRIDTLAKITVDSQNHVYHSNGNCIIETETKILHSGCNTSVIPADGSVKEIGEKAFMCSGLTKLVIPDG
ncbi:MAG: leucine-rich repeat domain-containing protein, partial [Clostridia bacterium]|nr:leucine-rich repeat domain-containing protein [Clostridia bacterium]